MAVYTDITEDDLKWFLTEYDVGELLSYKGIAEGVENSNFLLHTSRDPLILTLYEKRVDKGDLPFFLGLMQHLASRGLSCPLPLPRRDGALLGHLSGRPAALISFLEGMWLRKPEAHHCREVGKALAAMHIAGEGFEIRRPNALSLEGWQALWENQRPAPTKSRPACRVRSAANSISLESIGRRVCPKASSTPIFSRTMSSSSATPCPA